MTILSTIGYEASSLEDFIATLRVAGIKILVDVRQVPASRRKGFSKNALQAAVESVGIEYVHLVGLGDPKEGRDAAREGDFNKFLQVYKAHMKTPEFKADFQAAVEFTKGDGACLMCYERNHKECHRKLIAEKIFNIVGADIQNLGVREGIARDGYKVRSRARSNSRQGVAACG
jgi:uncharacterized protein (DUF488 family)